MGVKRSNGLVNSPSSAAVAAAPEGEGIILTDLSFNAIALDPGARAILRVRNEIDRQENPPQLPAEVVDTLRRHNPSSLSGVKTTFRVGSNGYTCRAYVLKQQQRDLPLPAMVALHIYKDSSTTDAIRQIADTYDLTEREREALTGILLGLTGKEVAERMNISPNTVKSFLRLVMIKMGVSRRGAIISKLLEHNLANEHFEN